MLALWLAPNLFGAWARGKPLGNTARPSSRTPRGRRGFTLIEALAAVAIVSIGVVAVLGGLGAVAKTEARARETEAMVRLASDKVEELIATRDYLTAATNGDFQELGEARFTWAAQVYPSGIESLDVVEVTVTREGTDDKTATASALAYTPPLIGGGGTL